LVEEGKTHCIFIYDQEIVSSYPVVVSSETEHRGIWDHLFRDGSMLNELFSTTIKRRHHRTVEQARAQLDKDLDLRVGEWVQVRSLNEIKATLDAKGALRGLSFMPEMERYCGRRLKVSKRVSRIMMESTGELRRLTVPTVLLEGASCDGSAHCGCDRSCPCFWREQWLKRVR
jgi:hypothetical protein